MTRVDGFWKSAEGRRYKSLQREISALRLALPTEPRSKKSSRPKDRAALAGLISEDAKPWLAPRGHRSAEWPRPRARVALDVHVSSVRRNSPRIDTICKWLLDELGGPNSEAIVFRDDRQVKLLFASKSVQLPIEEPKREADRSSASHEQPAGVLQSRGPMIYLTAQRLSLTFEGIRDARSIEPPWDPARVEDSPFLPDDFATDFDEDYLRSLRPELGGFQLEEWERISEKLVFTGQIKLIKALDLLSALAVTEMATSSTGLYDWLISPLRSNPYAFDLGPIPEAEGSRVTFKSRVADLMEERARAFPTLFPLRPIVGITVLYFETGRGKDLDNLVRSVIPDVIEHLRPPDEDQFFWTSNSKIADRLRSGQGSAPNEIQFVEAVALTRRPASVAPGTAFLLVSDGWRRHSWWESANDYVTEVHRERW